MTEAYKSLAIKILIAVLTSLATQLHLSGGASNIPAIATDVVDLALACYAFYRSSGMKLVPRGSIAVKMIGDDNAESDMKNATIGDHVALKNTAAKIVGCLAFVIMAMAWTQPVFAQATPTAPALNPAITQIYTVLNNILGFAGGFVQADLNAAIADAQAQTPPNTQAVSCWQAIAKIPPTAIPAGAALAYLKQRFLDLQGLYMPLNLNCGSVAPLFLKEYNQFMSLAAAQNL